MSGIPPHGLGRSPHAVRRVSSSSPRYLQGRFFEFPNQAFKDLGLKKASFHSHTREERQDLGSEVCGIEEGMRFRRPGQNSSRC